MAPLDESLKEIPSDEKILEMVEGSGIDSSEIVKKGDSFPAIEEDSIVVPAEEVKDDVVLLSVREEDDPDVVLKAVLYGLAEEQFSLRSLRKKKELESKDTSHISIKRGTLLKYMSETLIQRQALVGKVNGELDIRGPRFREIFKLFLETISSTFDEVRIPSEYKEMFFHALQKNLEGWENRAEKLVKSMQP